jgi:integrase
MGIILKIKNTKTIQFSQRSLMIPLPRLVDHKLCPVQAVFNAFRLCPGTPPNHPAFCTASKYGYTPLTGRQFDRKLQSCLQAAGYNSSQYSAHSLRRGGATWAYQVGLPAETIRAIGDWRSSAYLCYINLDNNAIYKAIQVMQHSLPG